VRAASRSSVSVTANDENRCRGGGSRRVRSSNPGERGPGAAGGASRGHRRQPKRRSRSAFATGPAASNACDGADAERAAARRLSADEQPGRDRPKMRDETQRPCVALSCPGRPGAGRRRPRVAAREDGPRVRADVVPAKIEITSSGGALRKAGSPPKSTEGRGRGPFEIRGLRPSPGARLSWGTRDVGRIASRRSHLSRDEAQRWDATERRKTGIRGECVIEGDGEAEEQETRSSSSPRLVRNDEKQSTA